MSQGLQLRLSREELLALTSHVTANQYLPTNRYHTLRQEGLTIHPPTRRGVAAGRNMQRPIKVLIHKGIIM